MLSCVAFCCHLWFVVLACIACRWLSPRVVVSCVLFVVCCLLCVGVVYLLWFAACRLHCLSLFVLCVCLFVVCSLRLLVVDCCLLLGACFSVASCCLLLVDCRVLFVAC